MVKLASSVGNTETFATGATRAASDDKPDYEGFLSPLVLEAYGQFMHYNRELEDGSKRASDNWQLGIPNANYTKSAFRHFMAWWKWHRLEDSKRHIFVTIHGVRETIVWALCAVIFNASGYLHNLLAQEPGLLARCRDFEEAWRQERREMAKTSPQLRSLRQRHNGDPNEPRNL
jgi:hypothetical protein